ncbi:peptidyl-prolyl cis-trans isomerase [Planctomycetota bacterium]|nr:peptidyl-prolyl cis-trans isomerase [Planctomycetota bacterium]
MPRRFLLIPLLIGAASAVEIQLPEDPATAAAKPSLASQVSGGIGFQIGQQLKQEGLDLEAFVAGVRDAFAGKQPKIDPAQIQVLMQRWQETRAAAQDAAGQERQKTNAAWLAENKKKPGITATASGLQYEVLASGKGRTPTREDTVTVKYEGKLIDGTVFDASARHGGDAEFPVGGVIPGWTEALCLMKEGDRWRLTIPSDLAYGANGPPGIGAHQVLIFEVELVAIKK